MSDRVLGTLAEVLARYPYEPGTNPAQYPNGSIERLRGLQDPEYRALLAAYYLRNQDRWIREETSARARELRQLHQPQSREHLEHWTDMEKGNAR